MQTKLIRVDLTDPALAATGALEAYINNISITQSATKLKLISSYVFGTDLMLIFQN